MKPSNILFLFFWTIFCVGVSTSFAAPKNPENYRLQKVIDLDHIPEGSIVQGSSSFGGIQPDYIVNFQNPQFDGLRAYALRLNESHNINLIQKVNMITNSVAHLLEKNRYEDLANSQLARSYRELGEDVPISEYAHHRAGVCREHALVLHLILDWMGIRNRYIYAKIERESGSADVIEDHAFNLIEIAGKEWVLDSYFKGFHGFLFKDLLAGLSKPQKLAGISDYDGLRRIVKINSFPQVWVPKSQGPKFCRAALKD